MAKVSAPVRLQNSAAWADPYSVAVLARNIVLYPGKHSKFTFNEHTVFACIVDNFFCKRHVFSNG
jgi:hypothetical protein